MKTYMTPEEHARLHRRRARQALGLLIAVLALVGVVTVVRAGVKGVATLFDDTQQKAEYEDRLEGLVLFDPLPFDGIENINDLTLREAAVWGCVYSIQETQGGFDNDNTDPDTEQLLLPSVDVDAYLAKLAGLCAGVEWILAQGVETLCAKETALAALFYKNIRDLPNVKIYGDPEMALHAPIISLNIGDEDSARIADILWEDYSICVRAGTVHR